MGFLFLDIETYVSEKNKNSSLNPYEEESKVLIISYSYYDSFKPPKKEEVKKTTYLKEWDSNEKSILKEFYDVIKNLKQKDKYLKFVGFNSSSFDLPYLFGRMKVLSIANEQELHEILFRPFQIDIYQLSSIVSEETEKYEQLWNISQKKVSKFFNLQEKEGEGQDCSRFYDEKDYDKILNYCKSEFNFEKMLECMYLYIKNNDKESHPY
jgi:DNA polymerase elongation subunit (family B)